MALTVENLINRERFSDENALQFLLYLPIGVCLLIVRIFMALILWIASIILPNKSSVRQMLSTFACWTFGVYAVLKGEKDPRCSVMVANYVSCLDSLAVSHVLGTICLRKWKLPPFFASTLGIRNVAQFVRKQHFADTPSQPVLLQPEGGPTNGKGLLRFTDWPFQLGNRVQPVAISCERGWSRVCVQGSAALPWRDAAWACAAPRTALRVSLLPALERGDDDDDTFAQRIRLAIADHLRIEATGFTWADVRRAVCSRAGRRTGAGGAGAGAGAGSELARLAARVKEVLPAVPLRDIQRDLASTRSVDVTITNFLEGVTPYTPETEVAEAGTSCPPPKYITPPPTGVFPKSARDRQISFYERKQLMIADARKRYVQKHGLDVAVLDR